MSLLKKVALQVEKQLSTDKNLVKIVPELVEINHVKQGQLSLLT